MRQRWNIARPLRAAPAPVLLLALVLLLAPGGRGAGRGAPTVVAPPEIEAGAWALVDRETGLLLAGENPDEGLPVASMTKVMSALVALREVEAGEASLDDEVTVSEDAESYVGLVYSNVGLISGETVTLGDLLVATLVPSGTDAVYALAEHLGDGSTEAFVARMNEEAQALGLRETRFESPAGLDTPENFASARDMAEICREALAYPEFAEIVGQATATIGTNNREIEIVNTNQLLSTYEPATGIKTGTSPESGPSLAASAESDGESYIAIVLDAASEDGAPGDRFEDAQAILEHGFGRYDREALVARDEPYEELPLPYRRGESVELVATEDVSGPVDAATEVERRVTADEPPPSARAGQELGEVEVLIGGQSVGRSPLVARQGYEEASIWQRVRYTVGGLFQ
ncbi:serine hydrolase [Rubrobacter marinus]|uniref:serine-type D-Ala-D-Ala carboxypeptidase n=1 Tax=Rubrobacter marinus TaxID=2653852 RepID=A0A6G8Q1L4_9ACTN|nr:D-alanyl-D-alanine carboxypeptidase family protein [Rubrobacter marinus]QIN80361.1 serine hydrolase [Rubrobacter marinus]